MSQSWVARRYGMVIVLVHLQVAFRTCTFVFGRRSCRTSCVQSAVLRVDPTVPNSTNCDARMPQQWILFRYCVAKVRMGFWVACRTSAVIVIACATKIGATCTCSTTNIIVYPAVVHAISTGVNCGSSGRCHARSVSWSICRSTSGYICWSISGCIGGTMCRVAVVP
jgi:hypothetical protein